jgi:uncharacterized protein YbaR (Trm112 family)
MSTEECCICLEENIKKLTCGHNLCIDCYKKMNGFQCPLCRKRIENYDTEIEIIFHRNNTKTYEIKDNITIPDYLLPEELTIIDCKKELFVIILPTESKIGYLEEDQKFNL